MGLALRSRAPIGRARHTMVSRAFAIAVYPAILARSAAGRPATAQSRWFRPSDLARAAVPTLTRKIASAAGFLRR